MISCLYSLIYTFPLAMVLTGIFEYFSGSTFDYLRKTVAVFVFAMALSLLKPLDRKRKIVISVLLIILLVTAGTVIVYIYPDIYELITGIYLFIPISFICVFICMIINYLSHYFTFIKYAQAALVLLLCIFCVILRIASEKADVVFAFMFIMTVLGEFVQNRRTVKEKPDTEKHMVSIFPFIFLASMILFAVPVKDEAYDWRFFIDAYNNVCDKIREFRIKISQNVFNKGLDDYLCVYTGFDDEALILPDASGRNKVQVMTYLPYYDYRESVYLSSGEFDIFDGHSWRSESHPSGNEKLIDAAQTVVASVASEQDPEMIYRMLRARITYQDICTATLFAPSKTTCVTDDGTPIDVILENGSYAFAGTEGYGTEYVIEYADINRDGEIISCASDSAEVPAGDAMYDILNGITGYDELKEITYEDIEEYRKEVYDIYLPETVLSERANEYIDGITAGALNDYEILQCIRDELSKNTYTLTPGRLPDDVDTPSEFVDYFLFEHPEGYCMHYATIFVLMARSQGIPARYVQGYLVNTEGYREVNVYSTDAHAWAEAYLDGIGWVIFDATPGYGDALSDSWNKNTEFEYARDNDYYREYYDSVSNDALTVSQNEADENGEADVLWLKIIIYISCGIPAAALIIYAVTKSILSANVSRLPLSERALIRCRKNTGLMKWLGIGCIYGATLHETGMEAENILGKEPKFIAIYEKILYSSYEPDDDDMRIIEDDGKMLMLLLKKKSILRYIYAVLFS